MIEMVDIEGKPHPVHLLVWRTFKGPIPVGWYVGHKDGDTSNNALENLELREIKPRGTYERRADI